MKKKSRRGEAAAGLKTIGGVAAGAAAGALVGPLGAAVGDAVNLGTREFVHAIVQSDAFRMK